MSRQMILYYVVVSFEYLYIPGIYYTVLFAIVITDMFLALAFVHRLC